jgi:hypothetical protein
MVKVQKRKDEVGEMRSCVILIFNQDKADNTEGAKS